MFELKRQDKDIALVDRETKQRILQGIFLKIGAYFKQYLNKIKTIYYYKYKV